jgi:hypothetical protein
VRTIIAGSRHYTDPAIIGRALEQCGWSPTEIVSGGAAGVDRMGEDFARAAGIPCRRFPANWSAHGKAAGPIRNREMAAHAEALIAIWDGSSRGTANMVHEAEARGLRVFVFTPGRPSHG